MSRVTINKRVVRHVARLGVVDAAVARDILAAAKTNAPNNSGDYTGFLTLDKGTKVDYFVTTNADHAAAFEFGHYNEDSWHTIAYVKGRHILAPALDSVT